MNAEIFYGSSDSQTSQGISKLLKSGKAKKIAPRIYTNNLTLAPEALIQKHILDIVEHFYPGSVLVHRSAFEVRPKAGLMVLSGKKRSRIELPGVTLYFVGEEGPHPKDMPFMGLFIAHEARSFLENLTRSRKVDGDISKNLSREELEARLLKKLEVGGESALNTIRDDARAYATEKGMEAEYEELNKMMGALMGTKDSGILSGSRPKAFVQGQDFDEERMKLFTDFFITLKDWPVKSTPDPKMKNPDHFRNKAFFESYFSNYIEGTEFEIEEAEEIVFDKKETDRPKDAHDVLGTFEIVSDAGEMRRVPKTEEEFLTILKARHLKLMSFRPEVLPGEWKQKNNRAGNTHFVEFEKVEATLRRAFSLIQALPPGLPRAAYMMFVVSEVHPFMDGNGRIARIMMNAELESQGLGSIIIPNSFREDYMLALKAVTKQQRFQPYLRMLERALKFSNMIDFTNYQKALTEVRERNWFLLPSEGKIIDV
ncbi:MAG: Fic family protein [Bdellovibrionales bacterium]|nr:Fic family protein [Bdellovibrionales bacterium]